MGYAGEGTKLLPTLSFRTALPFITDQTPVHCAHLMKTASRPLLPRLLSYLHLVEAQTSTWRTVATGILLRTLYECGGGRGRLLRGLLEQEQYLLSSIRTKYYFPDISDITAGRGRD
jgi:hypothetical protein